MKQVKFELDPPMLDTNKIEILYHHQCIVVVVVYYRQAAHLTLKRIHIYIYTL